jgi:hypothetical protein
MRLRTMIQRILIVAVAALTMAFAAAVQAESGCHRGGCAPPDQPNGVTQSPDR